VNDNRQSLGRFGRGADVICGGLARGHIFFARLRIDNS
jgi:hypothetical protein